MAETSEWERRFASVSAGRPRERSDLRDRPEAFERTSDGA